MVILRSAQLSQSWLSLMSQTLEGFAGYMDVSTFGKLEVHGEDPHNEGPRDEGTDDKATHGEDPHRETEV